MSWLEHPFFQFLPDYLVIHPDQVSVPELHAVSTHRALLTLLLDLFTIDPRDRVFFRDCDARKLGNVLIPVVIRLLNFLVLLHFLSELEHLDFLFTELHLIETFILVALK